MRSHTTYNRQLITKMYCIKNKVNTVTVLLEYIDRSFAAFITA